MRYILEKVIKKETTSWTELLTSFPISHLSVPRVWYEAVLYVVAVIQLSVRIKFARDIPTSHLTSYVAAAVEFTFTSPYSSSNSSASVCIQRLGLLYSYIIYSRLCEVLSSVLKRSGKHRTIEGS